jgi:hypothetical protein
MSSYLRLASLYQEGQETSGNLVRMRLKVHPDSEWSSQTRYPRNLFIRRRTKRVKRISSSPHSIWRLGLAEVDL